MIFWGLASRCFLILEPITERGSLSSLCRLVIWWVVSLWVVRMPEFFIYADYYFYMHEVCIVKSKNFLSTETVHMSYLSQILILAYNLFCMYHEECGNWWSFGHLGLEKLKRQQMGQYINHISLIELFCVYYIAFFIYTRRIVVFWNCRIPYRRVRLAVSVLRRADQEVPGNTTLIFLSLARCRAGCSWWPSSGAPHCWCSLAS